MRSTTAHASRAERRVGLLALGLVALGAACIVADVIADGPASAPRVASAELLTAGGVVLGGTVVVRVLGIEDEEDDELYPYEDDPLG